MIEKKKKILENSTTFQHSTMLFAKGLSRLILINLRIFNTFGSYLFKIDPVSYELSFQSSTIFKFKMFLKCTISTILSAIMAIQLIQHRTKFHNVDIFEGIFNSVAIQAFLASFYVYFKRRGQVVELFNSLVNFEQNLMNGKMFC